MDVGEGREQDAEATLAMTIFIEWQVGSQATVFGHIYRKRRGQGCRLEPTPYMDVSVSHEAGCRKRPWMY